MSKSILFFVGIVMLGSLMPNSSFAARPFLVEHCSIEQMNQSGHGRASFTSDNNSDKEDRKSVTLAESLVDLRQGNLVDEHDEKPTVDNTHSTERADNTSDNNSSLENVQSKNTSQSTSSQSTASNQSKKVFFARPQS